MSTFQFTKATKKQVKARIAIDGPSGSGKTYTSLIAAKALAGNGRIAVIDTERGSASLYSDKFDFDVLELNPPYSPDVYQGAIKAAENGGYSVIVIDSLSHAWEGEGGALDMADDATKRQKTPNSYTAWREVTPVHRAMVDAILQSKCHVIVTMRSKMEYVQEKNANGRTVINKVGMAPIQRSGMEYEFTIVGDMDLDNTLVISKTRFEPYNGLVQKKPGITFFKPFVEWLNSGKAVDQKTLSTAEANKALGMDVDEKPDPMTDYLIDTFAVDKPVAAPMTIEDACKVTTSQGKAYGEMTVVVLEKMLSAMHAKLANNQLAPEEKAEVEHKIKAAQMVYNAKKNKEI